MPHSNALQIGQHAQCQFIVEKQHTACAVGSGDNAILATPVLVTKMEALCHKIVKEHILLEQTSIGTNIQLSHDQMTVVGACVSIDAEIIQFNEKIVQFQITASDESGIIATGIFTRQIAKQKVLNRVLRLKQSQKNPIS